MLLIKQLQRIVQRWLSQLHMLQHRTQTCHIGSIQHFLSNCSVVTFPSRRYPMVFVSVLTMNYKNNLSLYRNSFFTETRTILYSWLLNYICIKSVNFKNLQLWCVRKKNVFFFIKKLKIFFKIATPHTVFLVDSFLFSSQRQGNNSEKGPGLLSSNKYFTKM